MTALDDLADDLGAGRYGERIELLEQRLLRPYDAVLIGDWTADRDQHDALGFGGWRHAVRHFVVLPWVDLSRSIISAMRSFNRASNPRSVGS